MSRKLLIVLAVLILSVLVLGACASNTAAEKPADQTASEPAPQEQPTTKSTLDVVRERGKIICGVNQAVPGFGFLQSDGSFAGFDIDFCKALSAAVFGDTSKVEYRPLNAKQRFTALQAGEIDVLIRNTTWTLTRDTELGANFAPTTFPGGIRTPHRTL